MRAMVLLQQGEPLVLQELPHQGLRLSPPPGVGQSLGPQIPRIRLGTFGFRHGQGGEQRTPRAPPITWPIVTSPTLTSLCSLTSRLVLGRCSSIFCRRVSFSVDMLHLLWVGLTIAR